MPPANIEIVNLSGKGISKEDSRNVAVWIAKAFAQAPATPALTIFFGALPYESNIKLHETFWASHINRVAMSGILLGAREGTEWRGFRAFFEPGKTRQPYSVEFRLEDNEDWDHFLVLAGQDGYSARIAEWSRVSSETNRDILLDPRDWFTTSILVVHPRYQRRRIGKALDDYTKEIIRRAHGNLHVRVHDHILPFYLSQGYKVIASPTYRLAGSNPFIVHFLTYTEDL